VDPLRGEVWDAHLRGVGQHPVVVLTISDLVPRLSSVTVVVITGTRGPAATHIALGEEAGLTKYDESYANATDVHTIPHASLRRRRGRLHQAELAHLEQAARLVLGL
jgi:mRNA interferase MazF